MQLIRRGGVLLAALLVSFTMLNAFCYVYSSQSPHVANSDGSTDYTWEPNSRFSKMTEGVSWGQVDCNGFNNPDGEPESISVLVVGSSHMEAMEVSDNESCAYLLNQRLSETASLASYNIGTSGHTLLVCLDNLDDALIRYNPTNAVVIEMSSVVFSLDAIEEVLSGTRQRIPSYDSGLIYKLQHVPFLRLAYKQFQDAISARGTGADIAEKAEVEDDSEDGERKEAMHELLSRAKAAVGNDRALIVLFHPTLALQEDGSVATTTDAASLEAFADECRECGIVFVDMTDAFLYAYETSHVLPHGFANASVGTGHLNADGHRMCADALYSAFESLGVA